MHKLDLDHYDLQVLTALKQGWLLVYKSEYEVLKLVTKCSKW